MTQDSQRRIAELEDQNAVLARQAEDLRCRHNLLRAVIDGTTDAVFVKDLQGRYLMVNPAACKFAGQSEEDILGQDDTKWFSAETARGIMELDRRIMSSGQSETDEEVGTAAGETRVYLSTKFPYRDEQGRIIGVIGIARDVTERKRIAAERQMFVSLANSSHEFIGMSDLEFKPFYANAAALRLVGLENLEAACRCRIQDFFFPEDQPFITDEFFPRVLREGNGEVEIRFRHFRTGEPIWMLYNVFNINDANGATSGWATVSRNITERKQAEQTLRASEERFATVFRSSPVGICVSKLADGTFLDVNDAFLKIIGHTREELIGRSSLDPILNYSLAPQDRRKLVESLLETGSVRNWEMDFRHKDGTVFDSFLSLERITLDGEDCILTILDDITERKSIEIALRDSKASLVAAQEQARMGSWELDPQTNTGWWSPGMFRLFDRAEVLGVPSLAEFLELVHPDDRQRLMDSHATAVAAGQISSGDFRFNTVNGEVRYFTYTRQCLTDSQGRTVRLAGTSQDITERMRTIEEQQASRERLAILSRQLITAQESERRHLARELHDEIGQVLTAINLNLQLVKSNAPEHVQPKVADGLQLVGHAIQQVRDLSLNLRPSMLDDFGLRATLEWFLERQRERSSCAFHLETRNEGIELSPDFRTVCYRVVQEAVTNVQRHSHARNVWVALEKSTTGVKLSIRDDGRGFDVAAAEQRSARGGSMGLLGMRERVELLGGKCAIHSAPDAGTTIQVEFPLGSEADEEVISEEQAA